MISPPTISERTWGTPWGGVVWLNCHEVKLDSISIVMLMTAEGELINDQQSVLTLSNCLQANLSSLVMGNKLITGLDIIFTEDSIASAQY